MRKQDTVFVRFAAGAPVWSRLVDGVFEDVPPQDAAGGASLIALLPDKFFFYHLPRGIEGRNSRQSRNALKLQLQHLWPAQDNGRHFGVFAPPAGGLLGYCTHPALHDFVARHQEILKQATVLTTEFLLVYNHALASDLSDWMWHGEDGMRAALTGDILHYFQNKDDEELVRRLDAEKSGSELQTLTLEASAALLEEAGTRPTRLHLHIPGVGPSSKVSPRFYKGIMIAASILGLLFTSGQMLRYYHADAALDQVRDSLKAEYAKVLGKNSGSDPYGKLLSRLSQAKGAQAMGIDFIKLLTVLSQKAPDGFYFDNMTLNRESGMLRGTAPSYDAVEQLLASFESVPEFNLVLEQATNSDAGVAVTLKINYGS